MGTRPRAEILEFRGVLHFLTTDPTNGTRIWRTDGTQAGTAALGSVGANATAGVVVGQNMFFVATDPTLGRELYVLPNDAPTAGNDSGHRRPTARVS